MGDISGYISLYRNYYAIIFDELNESKIKNYISNSNINIPIEYINYKNERNTDYHITLSVKKTQNLPTNVLINLNILGIGLNNDCYYLVCISKELDNILNNIIMDYHITIAFNQNDKHNISKSIDTLIYNTNDIENILITNISNNTSKNIKLLKELYDKHKSYKLIKILINQYCISGNYNTALSYTYELIELDSNNIMGYYMQFKILMHLNLVNLDIINSFTSKLLQLQNIKQPIVYEFIKLFNLQIVSYHNNPNKPIQIININNLTNQLELYELPTNFSFIDDNYNIFGSGNIEVKHVKLLHVFDIATIINLIGEKTPNEELLNEYKKYNINFYHIGFTDQKACTLETYTDIINKINNSTKCLIHCKGGIGRTNMVLAGYLMQKQKISPSEAITHLKNYRKVILTSEQIMFLKTYYGHIHNNEICQLPKGLSNTLLLMVGLPCSGKTTFALELIQKYGTNIIHINQDELGKTECENMLSYYSKKSGICIILDRCNATKEDRLYWSKITSSISSLKISAICFNLGVETSLSRLSQRTNHPTLHNTSGGENIIRNMSCTLVLPNKATEPQLDNIYIINNMEDLENLKTQFGLNNSLTIKPIKFPRTKHIANLGAMSKDDLLMDKSDIEQILKMNITIEEKIDGSNMGISLDSNNNIRIQNRSHYINSSYHIQYKKLDEWITNAEDDLRILLNRPNGHKYIIYGEWMYLKHSIHYTKLPSYFIMFDLYNTTTNTFMERNEIENIIASNNLSITLVPLIFKGKITMEKIKTFVNNESAFYDGPIEGIYIRAYENNEVKYRCKLVRSNFVCGNETWNKNIIINTLI